MRRLALALALLLLAACDRSPAAPAFPADAGGPDAGGDAGTNLRLFDAGREPRSPLRFAFTPGREEAAELTLDSRLARGDSPLGEERLRLLLRVRYPTADKVELTVRGAETTGQVPRLATTIGTVLLQRFLPTGEAEMPELTPAAGADTKAAEYVHGALTQIASNLLAPVPAESIGEGARWAHDELRFEVTRRRGPALVIERRSEIRGERKLATGETVFASEAQVHRLELVPDGIARRVEAELVADQPTGAVMTTRMRLEIEGAN